MSPTAVQEDIVLLSGLYLQRVTVNEPVSQLVDGTLSYRHEPLFRPLAHDAYVALVHIEVRELQRDKL